MGWDRLIDLEAKVTQLAVREACKYIDEKLSVKVEKLGKDSLVNCAKTSMSSKLIATDSGFFANLVVDVKVVKTMTARGEIKYPIKGINILKAHVKSAKDSYLLKGYALNTGHAARGMPTRVAPARIACLHFNLQKTKMQMGAFPVFLEAGAISVMRVRKEDLHYVAKATGAIAVSTFADMEGEETFDKSLLGYADEVVEERISDDDAILVKGTKTTSAV